MDSISSSSTRSAARGTVSGRLTRFARTTAFRLALVYAALFTVAVGILFSIIYWEVSTQARYQIRLAIEAETRLMLHEAEEDSLGDLARMITHLERLPSGRIFAYLLMEPSGRRLAGTLPELSVVEGWTEIAPNTHVDADQKGTMIILGTRLPNHGALLFVGRRTVALDDLLKFIATAFLWAAAATFGLAILYGVVTGLAFRRRVELVNTAAARIIGGDLANRVPVRGTNDELDQLSRNLNRMLDRIGDLIEGLRHVSNDIAHDLRTPLARLRQGLEAARTKARCVDDYEAAVDRAIEQTDEILSTFGALLRIAQIEARVGTSHLREVDLSEVFARIEEAYRPVAEDAGKTIIGTIAPGVATRGDRELLTQMMANLVENALRHTPRGTTIELGLANGKAGLIGTVADNGCGIPQDAREKVFERFYRLDESRSTAGSGLGLALVAAIADLHGITITLTDNSPGLRVVLAFAPSVVDLKFLPVLPQARRGTSNPKTTLES